MTGGGPPLHALPTIGDPQFQWSPTNTGESDTLQIIIESTQRGSEPTPPPPPPPPPITGAGIR